MNTTIKDAFLEIKEIVFGNHDVNIEEYAKELSNRTEMSFDDAKNAFNNMNLIYINEKEPSLSYAKRKKWCKGEEDLVFDYVELVSREKIENNKGDIINKSVKRAFEELEGILIDRNSSSIATRYYEIKKQRDGYYDTLSDNKNKQNKKNNSDNDDLLDITISLVENIEKAGLDVNNLFKNLLHLSVKAVDNSDNKKIDKLEGEIQFLSTELDSEKQKNKQLQSEVLKIVSEFESLKREVYYFDGLDSKQKLQQLNNFNKKIKYIIDKFGGVISVSA